MYFGASFKSLSTGLIDISADGQNIVIVDNSNYRDYTGTAITGGASSITLPSDASPYDDYYNGMAIEILAGTSVGDVRYITDYDGTTKVATINTAWASPVDATSVFEIGEPGHLTSYFTDYRKVNIICPDATDYLFSSVSDGDATTTPAATSTLPITDTYAYTTGDGVYIFTLYTVPTWNIFVPYLYVRNVCVYFGGVLYSLLKDSQGVPPGTDATVWEAITSIEDLPAKYRTQVYVAIICDTVNCYRNYIVSANTLLNCTVCNNEIWMRNASVQKAFKLKMAIDAIPILMYQSLYDEATTTINLAKNICCCN